MDYELNENALKMLSELYYKCRSVLGVTNGSVVGSIISKTNNGRADVLRKASSDLIELDSLDKDSLVEKNYVVDTGDGDRYVITFKGIWFVESMEFISNENDLINWIQNKYFDPLFKKDAEVGDRDKCMAFALISMRAFSEGSCMDLMNDSGIRTIWWDILKQSSSYLHSIGITKTKIDDSTFKDKDTNKVKGSDDPVVNVARHSFNLNRPSAGRYQTGKLTYWFDISEQQGQPSEQVLARIIRQIFGKIDSKIALNMSEHSNAICMDYGWKIEQHYRDVRFFDVEYDQFIKKAFEEASKM